MNSSDQPSEDAKLRLLVLRTLSENKQTHTLDLHVGVLNRIVHLAGEASSEELWHITEQLVANISGVRGVVNRIQAPGAPSPSRTINLDLSSSNNESGRSNRA